jgi:hypothetical protein
VADGKECTEQRKTHCEQGHQHDVDSLLHSAVSETRSGRKEKKK